jgi:hypothetical protein
LQLGDSLRQRIDEGLANSRYGVVVLSPAFFAKRWPQLELDGLLTREVAGGKVVLPVWHRIAEHEVRKRSPILASKLAARSEDGLQSIVAQIDAVLNHAAEQLPVAVPLPLAPEQATVAAPIRPSSAPSTASHLRRFGPALLRISIAMLICSATVALGALGSSAAAKGWEAHNTTTVGGVSTAVKWLAWVGLPPSVLWACLAGAWPVLLGKERGCMLAIAVPIATLMAEVVLWLLGLLVGACLYVFELAIDMSGATGIQAAAYFGGANGLAIGLFVCALVPRVADRIAWDRTVREEEEMRGWRRR